MTDHRTIEQRKAAADDAAKAIKFLAIKAAVFILIPAVAAIIAVYLQFR